MTFKGFRALNEITSIYADTMNRRLFLNAKLQIRNIDANTIVSICVKSIEIDLILNQNDGL